MTIGSGILVKVIINWYGAGGVSDSGIIISIVVVDSIIGTSISSSINGLPCNRC